MNIDDKICQFVPVNTITDAYRARIGAEVVQAASTALIADLCTQLDSSSFLAVDASSVEVLTGFETLRRQYVSLLFSVCQKVVRIGQRTAYF